MHVSSPVQVRKFQPEMVAIRDPSKIPELKEAIKDLPQQPVILGGDEGAVEVARHPSAEVGPAFHGCVLGAGREGCGAGSSGIGAPHIGKRSAQRVGRTGRGEVLVKMCGSAGREGGSARGHG